MELVKTKQYECSLNSSIHKQNGKKNGFIGIISSITLKNRRWNFERKYKINILVKVGGTPDVATHRHRNE